METLEKTYAGINVDCNGEGYLTKFSQWNKEVGLEIAKEEGITMTDRHWEVIKYLQDQYKNEVPLSIRKVGKSGVVTIKEFYDLKLNKHIQLIIHPYGGHNGFITGFKLQSWYEKRIIDLFDQKCGKTEEYYG